MVVSQFFHGISKQLTCLSRYNYCKTILQQGATYGHLAPTHNISYKTIVH